MDLTSGDAFESWHADWIRRYLPNYEKVWEAFIGHDGNGLPCKIQNLSDELESDRKQFYQAHYSFVPKMLAIDDIASRLNSEFDRVDAHNLHEAMQELFNMMAAIGYVRDMFKKMHEALGNGLSMTEQLQELYDM